MESEIWIARFLVEKRDLGHLAGNRKEKLEWDWTSGIE